MSAAAQAASFSSWIVYWDHSKSLQAYEKYGGSLEEVSVFAYKFNENGVLVPARPEVVKAIDAVRLDKRSRTAVSVANDHDTVNGPVLKDPTIVHDILASPERRAAHINELLRLAEGFDGVEMDYENLLLADRDGYAAFIADLARALREKGKKLSVVVQAKTQEVRKDGPGAMDWKALGASADQIKVMAYNYHTSRSKPGAISPPLWIRQIARFAKTQVPLEKLCVVLPLHGFDWKERSVGADMLYEGAMALAASHGAAPERDAESWEKRFRYEERGERHVVWFQDEESLRAKVEALQREGVEHIGLWKLGTGAPAFWESLASGALKTGR